MVWRRLLTNRRARVLASVFALAAVASGGARAQPDDHTQIPPVRTADSLCATDGDGGVRQLTQARRIVHQRGASGHDIEVANDIVTLPDDLPNVWRQDTHRLTYSWRIDCTLPPGTGLALYRVGAPYVATLSSDEGPSTEARMDRHLDALGQAGHAAPGVINGRIATVFPLTGKGMATQGQRLNIRLQTLPYLPAGMTLAYAGPVETLVSLRNAEHASHFAGASVTSYLLVLQGLMMVILWNWRRHEWGMLWLALGCLAWGARGVVYHEADLSLPPLLFELSNPFLVLTTGACMTLATNFLVRRGSSVAIRRLAWVVVPALGCLLVSLVVPRLAAPSRLLAFLVCFGVVGSLFPMLWARRDRLRWWRAALLVLGICATLITAVHDMLIVFRVIGPTSVSWLFWGFVIALMGYVMITAEYMLSMLTRAEHSNEVLEQHIRQATQSLEQSYSQLREREVHHAQELARVEERGRLMREMHDGMGAQLMTALRGVERGSLAPAQIQDALQGSLDDLRLLMDSTDLGQTLHGALIAWRNRWAPRLQALGLELHWQVDDAVTRAPIGADAALHIMRILQEAAVNALRHAQAQRLSIVTTWSDATQTLNLTVTDDGHGLATPSKHPRGRGLGNMATRAQAIGAALDVAALAAPDHGTQVRLQWRIHA